MIKLLLLNKYLKVSKLIVCLLLFNNTIGQNLIRNGSFENYNTPLNWNWWEGDFIGYYSIPPDTVMIDWTQLNSPDFFMTACTHTSTGAPLNGFGNSYPKDGGNYIGIGVYTADSEYKEYIYQHLSSPLQAGKTYCLSFFTSRADRITYSIKNIGAYFSNNLQSIGTTGYVNAMPQIVNQSGFISDTTQWTEVQGCFTANGGEQYITIGNFNANTNTDTLRIPTTNYLTNGPFIEFAYYYIDNITLVDQTMGVDEFGKENRFKFYPNPNNGKFEISNIVGENYIVEITNSIGQVIKIINVQRPKMDIDLSSEPSGIYFCNLLQKGKNLRQSKIVIIK